MFHPEVNHNLGLSTMRNLDEATIGLLCRQR